MKRRLTPTVMIGIICFAIAVAIPGAALGIGGGGNGSPPSAPAVDHVSSSQAGGLDASTANTLRALNTQGVGAAILGKRLLGQARTLTTSIHGKHVYLVPTETGKVCLDVEQSSEGWYDALSQSNPVLLAAKDDDGPGGIGPTVFGVAIDGVRSVTFDVGGARQVVPVTANAFVYQADSQATVDSVTALSATLSDGSEQLLR